MKSKLRQRRESQVKVVRPLPFQQQARALPAEGVKDQRVVGVFSISVSWRETQGARLQVIAGNPMMHHGQAGAKRRPAW